MKRIRIKGDGQYYIKWGKQTLFITTRSKTEHGTCHAEDEFFLEADMEIEEVDGSVTNMVLKEFGEEQK